MNIEQIEIRLKHCQRHNGPRVLTLYLELSLQLNRMPHALVPNLANCITSKFGHQMALLALDYFDVK